MKEYIEREAIGKAYMDLCLAKSKLAKSRKGATFFQSDLFPETEPTTKELFGLVMAMPAADVAPVVCCKDCQYYQDAKTNPKGFLICPASGMEITEMDYCSYGALMDGKEAEHEAD